MEKSIILLLAVASMCWSIPKPMESITNYNVMMVHGAYGASKGFGNKDFVESRLKKDLPEAMDTLPDWSLSKTLYILDTNPADVTSQMGNPSDYKAPVKSGSLWKLVPKDASKPTLFYSECVKRVVKMIANVNGSSAEMSFEYCDASCNLPGTLKKTEIVTALPSGEKSIVVMEVVSAKARHILPAKMFNVE